MNRVRRHARRHRLARAVLLITAALGAVVYIACSDDPARYEPLGGNPPAQGGIIAGHVRDGSAGAVKGAVVAIEPLTDGAPATALRLKDDALLAGKFGSQPDATGDGARRVTLTDENGRYVFDGMAGGEYAVSVRADDHLGASAQAEVPYAALTIDTIIVDVNLTPTGTFSGIATLENGASHQNIVVYAEGTSYVAVTDPTGAYAISDVPVGGYTIRAMHAHYLDDTESGTLTFAGQNFGLPPMFLRLDNNIPPTANITIPVQTMETGTPITFQSSGNDIDGTVVLYEWDFENDGIIDSGSPTPGSTNHTYNVAGNYTVKLRVTDNQGAIGLWAETITVSTPPPFTVVYMSPAGSDTNSGASNAPVLTLVKAYQIAQANAITDIRVAVGTYNQVPTFLAGINVESGYDGTTWLPTSGFATFNVGTTRAHAHSIAVATVITKIEIVASNQITAGNSTALYSSNSTAALQFNSCRFISANANGSGPHGGVGFAGAAGGVGAPGSNGSCDGAGVRTGGPGGTSPVCAGGKGGDGGLEGANDGQAGSNGACAGGANGGIKGNGGDPGQPGGTGTPGADGNVGSSGTPSSPNGSIVLSDWAPSLGGNGGNGTDAKGGGGGGGGGGQGGTFIDDGAGNGGGGGGGAGTAGGGGFGGLGGYGSIAVLLINSSPTFQNCFIQTGAGSGGRNGGNGGAGGTGGTGGLGATLCSPMEVGKGGDGGKGGNGGHGGGGAGGAGGPSVGIVRGGTSTPTLVAVTYSLGVPGGGGTGGLAGGVGPAASAGPIGVVGNTLILP